MSQNIIDISYDLPKLEKQTQKAAELIDGLYNQLKKVDGFKLEFQGVKGFGDFEKANKRYQKAIEDTNKELNELKKVQKSIEDTYAKRIALESEEAKILAEEKELLRLRNAELKNTVRETNAAEGSIEQMRATLLRLNKEYDNLSQSEREAAGGGALRSNIAILTDNLKQLEGETGRFQRNVGNYSGAVKVLESALQETKDKLDSLTQAGNGNDEMIQQLQKEYSLLDRIVNNQANGFVSMREEIKQNQVAIEQLSLIYGEDSNVVQELILQNGKLRDSFDDLKATQKTLGSDTFVFDGLLQAGQALTGVYAAATGAAALFGDENEALQKQMVKLQAVLAIVQGVQATVNALQTEGAAIQLLNTVRTKAAAAAQVLYTFATSGATVATNALRVALISTGIGAILVLLGTAAAAMTSFGNSTKKATNALEEQEAAANSLAEVYDYLNTNLQQAEKIQLALAKFRGATESDQLKIQLETLQARKANIIEQQRLLINSDSYGEAQSKQYNELTKQLGEVSNEIQVKTIETGAAINKEQEDRTKKSKEESEERKEIAARESQARFDILKMDLEQSAKFYKDVADNQDAGQSARLHSLTEYAKIETSIINGERDNQLKDEKLLPDEREKIKREAQIKLINLEDDIQHQITEIIKKGADDQLKAEEEAAQKRIEGKESGVSDRVTRNQILMNQELRRLNEDFQNGDIKSTEEYEKKKAEIVKAYTDKSIDEQISLLQGLLDTEVLTDDKRIELESKVAELKMQKSDQATQKQLDNNKKLLEDETALAERKKQLASETYDLVTGLFSGQYEKEKNDIQEQIDLNNDRYAQDVANIQNSTLSEQEKADKLTALEKQKEVQQTQLEKRQRDAAIRQAKFDRDAQALKIIGETYFQVAKAGFITPTALIIAALGAVQVAALFARPLPKYAKGTGPNGHPGGLAEVGEEYKPELVQEPGGRKYIVDSPSILNLPQGTSVTPITGDMLNTAMNGAMFRNTTYALSIGEQALKVGGNKELISMMAWQTRRLEKAYKSQTTSITVNISDRSRWNTFIDKNVGGR